VKQEATASVRRLRSQDLGFLRLNFFIVFFPSRRVLWPPVHRFSLLKYLRRSIENAQVSLQPLLRFWLAARNCINCLNLVRFSWSDAPSPGLVRLPQLRRPEPSPNRTRTGSQAGHRQNPQSRAGQRNYWKVMLCKSRSIQCLETTEVSAVVRRRRR
jgi:hypothetical protein